MRPPQRILLIGPTPPHRGGLVHFTAMLSTVLRHDHDVTVWGFAPLYPAWLFPGNTASDPSLTPIPCQVDAWLDGRNPWDWWRQLSALTPGTYDVVLWQWWTPYWIPFIWMLHVATRRAGIPTLVISHQLSEPDAPPWQQWLAGWALQQAAGVLVLGSQPALLAQWGKPWRAVPLPLTHAALTQVLPTRGAARQALGIATDVNVVLFFGFVRRYKGLDTVLRAMQQTHTPFVLLIAGEWWDDARAVLAPLVAHPALAGRLIIHDYYIPNEQVANYLQAADVLVLPYRSGSVSGVATLAASVGLPILASTQGAIGQQTGTMATIPPDDSVAWAVALDQHVGQTARTRPAPDVSWQFFYQQLHEVWHDIRT